MMAVNGRYHHAVVVIATGACLLAAACSKASGPATASAAPAGVALSSVQKIIDQYTVLPKFQPPGPAFDVSKARGKTIFYIPLNSSIPFDNLITQASRRAAQAAGAKFVEYSNQGQPSQWIQGMNAAVSQKADVIVLEGSPDPRLLGPQIAAAKSAGIPVISTHLYDASYVSEARRRTPGLAAIVPANHYKAGTLEADYAILAGKGRVDVLFITSNEVQPSVGITDNFVQELKRRCPITCKATVVNIPLTDWASKIPTAVPSALAKDPKINFVVPAYDGMTQFIQSGLAQAGAQARVKVVAYNGTASVLQMIQRKSAVVADVGEPTDWLGWADVDQALRLLAGVPPVASENTPLRIFDSSNVEQAGKPANQTDGYGNPQDFIAGYKKLWGIG